MISYIYTVYTYIILNVQENLLTVFNKTHLKTNIMLFIRQSIYSLTHHVHIDNR